MLKTDTQYYKTKKEIERLNYISKSLGEENPFTPEKTHKINQINQQISQHKSDCDNYRHLKNSDPENLTASTLDELTQLPIKYRISSGMTVDNFAKYVNITVRQINRYEKQEYQNINLGTFRKILNSLNIKIDCQIIG